MNQVKPKIFIVEDESIVAFDIECCLKKNGYDVVGSATSHVEIMEKVSMTKPDLVLMDIRIHGDIDGIECAKQLRNIFETPVVFLTAHSDNNTIERATKTRAFGYVLKPFNEKSLVTNIEMALSNFNQELKVLQGREKFSITLDKLNLGVIIFDIDGKVNFINLSARALTGWDKNKVIGKPLESLLYDKSSGKPINFETVLRERVNLCLLDVVAQDSETPHAVSLDLTIAPIFQAGNFEGGMVIFHDYQAVIHSAYTGGVNYPCLPEDSEDSKHLAVLELCPWCKKWKDEEDNWNQIEEFLKTKVSARLHHSACPDCVKLLIRNVKLKLEKNPRHRMN